MARPKRNDPAEFTGGEVAEATGLSVRNIQYLRDSRIGPFLNSDQAGGNYGEDTLAELAMIAGCMGAGFSLKLASAIVSAFLQENPNHTAARFCMIDTPGTAWSSAHRIGSTWFHRYSVMRGLGEPAMTSANDDDQAVLIADRTHVLSGTWGLPRMSMSVPKGVDSNGPQALGLMDGLSRGGEPTFRPVWMGEDLSEEDRLAAVLIEYQEAARNALALSAVNLSLAIRRAFAAVYAMRAEKGGPFWKHEG